MERENALHDLSYIKKLISETQQIMDITWPIYIYWGIEIILSILLSTFFINYKDIERGGLSLSLLLNICIEVSLWGGFAGTALYVYFHHKKMINQKMFLIGTIGASLILIKIVEIIGFRLIVMSTGYNEVSAYFSTLINGTYFASLFIILGLVYAREQLWLGYGLLLITLLSLCIDVYNSKIELFGITFVDFGMLLIWVSVGASFLVAGIYAYNRYRKQIEQENNK